MRPGVVVRAQAHLKRQPSRPIRAHSGRRQRQPGLFRAARLQKSGTPTRDALARRRWGESRAGSAEKRAQSVQPIRILPSTELAFDSPHLESRHAFHVPRCLPRDFPTAVRLEQTRPSAPCARSARCRSRARSVAWTHVPYRESHSQPVGKCECPTTTRRPPVSGQHPLASTRCTQCQHDTQGETPRTLSPLSFYFAHSPGREPPAYGTHVWLAAAKHVSGQLVPSRLADVTSSVLRRGVEAAEKNAC